MIATYNWHFIFSLIAQGKLTTAMEFAYANTVNALALNKELCLNKALFASVYRNQKGMNLPAMWKLIVLSWRLRGVSC